MRVYARPGDAEIESDSSSKALISGKTDEVEGQEVLLLKPVLPLTGCRTFISLTFNSLAVELG